MTRLLLRRRSAALLLVLMLAGCMHQVHPGAVSQADSYTYDVLTMAQASLWQANVELREGTLPARALPAYNTAVESYNKTRTLWLDYRNAGGSEAKLSEATRLMVVALGELNRIVGRLP